MNFSRASTDAFSRFLRFHEQFNRLLPVGTAGLLALRLLVDGPSGSVLLGAIVDATGEPWTKRRVFPNPADQVLAARSMFCNMAVVRAVAAFDAFTTSLTIDATEFSGKVRAMVPFQHQHTGIASSPKGATRTGCCHAQARSYLASIDFSERMDILGTHFGWHGDAHISALLPFWQFFRRARNRIVHGDGTCGEHLAEYAVSTEFAGAVAHWNSHHARHKAPELPHLAPDSAITFEPRHAILAESVQFAIAKRADPYVAAMLGPSGLFEMAVYYGLLAPAHPYRTARQKTLEGAVNLFLSRYRVKDVSPEATATLITQLGLRPGARQRFKETYG